MVVRRPLLRTPFSRPAALHGLRAARCLGGGELTLTPTLTLTLTPTLTPTPTLTSARLAHGGGDHAHEHALYEDAAQAHGREHEAHLGRVRAGVRVGVGVGVWVGIEVGVGVGVRVGFRVGAPSPPGRPGSAYP